MANIHEVHTEHSGGMAFTSQIGEHQVRMDASAEHGGMNLGPGPKKLMLVSLAGCTGIDVVSILDKMKASYSQFSIDVSGQLSSETPATYTSVHITYRISMKEADRAKMEKAVALSQDKYCGVSTMFRAFATVTYEIIYL